jgi:hypothetical protein
MVWGSAVAGSPECRAGAAMRACSSTGPRPGGAQRHAQRGARSRDPRVELPWSRGAVTRNDAHALAARRDLACTSHPGCPRSARRRGHRRGARCDVHARRAAHGRGAEPAPARSVHRDTRGPLRRDRRILPWHAARMCSANSARAAPACVPLGPASEARDGACRSDREAARGCALVASHGRSALSPRADRRAG